MAAATYTKLKSGEWGVRVNGSIRTGDKVTVVKKSGASKVETVARVLWTGNGVSVCSIAQRASDSRTSVERKHMEKYGWDGIRGSSSYYSSGMYDEDP